MSIFLFKNIFVLHVYACFFFRFVCHFSTNVYICFIVNLKTKNNDTITSNYLNFFNSCRNR